MSNIKLFKCELCNFQSTLKTNYISHCKTNKHNNIINNSNNNSSFEIIQPNTLAKELELQKKEFEIKLLESKLEMLMKFHQEPQNNEPIGKKKILPITYMKQHMNNLINYLDIDFSFINDDDRSNLNSMGFVETVTCILKRAIKLSGGKRKFPITCLDLHRKKLYFNTIDEDTDELKWIEDDDKQLFKCLVYKIGYILISGNEEELLKFNEQVALEKATEINEYDERDNLIIKKGIQPKLFDWAKENNSGDGMSLIQKIVGWAFSDSLEYSYPKILKNFCDTVKILDLVDEYNEDN